jgi:hypothetical protein
MTESACAPSGTTPQATQSRTTHDDQQAFDPVASTWSDSCRRRQTARTLSQSQNAPCEHASGLCGALRRSLFAPRMKGRGVPMHADVRTDAMTGHLLLQTSRNAPLCGASAGPAAVRCDLSCCIIPFPTNGRAVNGGASTACIMPACNACVIRWRSWVPHREGRTRTSLLVAGKKASIDALVAVRCLLRACQRRERGKARVQLMAQRCGRVRRTR